MKLQKSGFMLMVLLMSCGAEVLGMLSEKPKTIYDLLSTPPAVDIDQYILDWLEKNSKEVANNLSSNPTFEQIQKYANKKNLKLPANLTKEQKTFVVAGIQARQQAYEDWSTGFDVADDYHRMNDQEVLDVARKEIKHLDTKLFVEYIKNHKLSIDTFKQLSDAFDKAETMNPDLGWDDQSLDRATMTDVEKENWVRVYKKVSELFTQERLQHSKHLYKVVEVVQDLAQQEMQTKEQKSVSSKNQIFNLIEVVDMVAQQKDIDAASKMVDWLHDITKEEPKLSAAEKQQQLNRTLEVVAFANDVMLQKADEDTAAREVSKRSKKASDEQKRAERRARREAVEQYEPINPGPGGF